MYDINSWTKKFVPEVKVFRKPNRIQRELTFSVGESLYFVGRREWGANKWLESTESRSRSEKIKHVIFQSTNTSACVGKTQCCITIKNLQEQQMEDGADDIHYNFLVTGSGKIYKGRGWFYKPHLPDDNLKDITNTALTIGFVGDFEGPDKVPSYSMMDGAINLIKAGIRGGMISVYFQLTPLRK